MKDQLSFDDSDDSIALQSAWANAMTRLSQEVPKGQVERFLKPMRPLSVVDGVVSIAVPGKFVHEWVHSRYEATIQSMLGDEFGTPITLKLIVEARDRPAQNETARVVNSAVVIPPKAEPSFRLIERYAFDTFVVGQSNRLAFAGASAVAKQPGQKFNPLFIYGASGLGKTHLLHAIAREILARDPGFHLVYVTAQQFAEDFVHALQSNRIEQFRRMQRSVGIWLVDDIQLVAGKDKTQEEVFHTFNYLYNLGKQIVLTSDRPPRDLYLMDERLRSRFESGLVADVQMPDTETRCAIIQSKSQQEKVDLSHEVAMFLAENVPGNIRILEGALTKLVVQASLEERPLDLAAASEMVEKYYRRGSLAKPGFDQIVETVSRHFKIPTDDIRGTSRKAPIVHARHVAVFITREVTGDSWKHIGALFGDRDHTSMMHGYTKIHELMHYDRDLRTIVKMLIRNLHPDG